MNVFRRLPVVTVLLIVANLFGAFAATLNPDLDARFGFQLHHPTLQTAFTSLFLHANLLHLLGNMVFLAAVGAAVELATGSFRFVCVYFVSGLAGLALHFLILRHEPGAPIYVGSSGSIAGCAGYYSLRYTGMRVPIAPSVSMSVATVTGIWIALQAVGAFVRIGDTGGVAFWAHIGGFATGLVLSAIFRAPDLGQLKLRHEVLEKMNERGPAAAAEAARRHLKEHPGDPKALEQLAAACAKTDDHQGEADAILELLAISPAADEPLLMNRLLQIGMASRISSHRRTVLGEKWKLEHPEVARALLTSVVEGDSADTQRPEALLSLAALDREQHPQVAEALLQELSVGYPLHPCTDLARKRGWIG